ncbi:hypothetical protein DAPPUDRAFT_255585 [Daphnia pulex]|uniref:Uncharacterized protein n=1 Tax=Daphnia pulex TaxID=6669 RepID=E9H9J7_DAPPU|nr:hypothetical protein DAPPUDRAFT_255585 [Daphnia pulex]|eukprot:EFX71639.1 hypothetical protein DAPPUDRAFT_255585 [Daphnia pulex]
MISDTTTTAVYHRSPIAFFIVYRVNCGVVLLLVVVLKYYTTEASKYSTTIYAAPSCITKEPEYYIVIPFVLSNNHLTHPQYATSTYYAEAPKYYTTEYTYTVPAYYTEVPKYYTATNAAPSYYTEAPSYFNTKAVECYN